MTGSRVCQRWEAMEKIRPCSLIVGNLRVKTDATDGSKKKERLNTTQPLYSVMLSQHQQNFFQSDSPACDIVI